MDSTISLELFSTSNRPFFRRFLVLKKKGVNLKYLLRILFVIFVCSNTYVVHADTITMTWLNEDGTTYDTTTCNAGGDVILPTAPTKTGYNFVGWAVPKYYPLQYIDSVPSDSYLDTGFIVDINTKIVIDSQKTLPADMECPLIKSDKVVIKKGTSSGFGTYESAAFGNSANLGTGNLGDSMYNRNTISLSKNGYYRNGNKRSNVSQTPFTSTTSLIIFNNNCYFRLFSLQIYQEDVLSHEEVLIHDYVPAMTPEGIICLYDKVTDSFLYNSGSQPLVAGPILDYD